MALETETIAAPPIHGMTADKVKITRVGDQVMEEAPASETTTETQDTTTASTEGEQTAEATTAEATTDEGGVAPEGGETTTTDEPGEYTEEDFQQDMSSYLDETTGGLVKKPEDLKIILEENRTLKEQLKNKAPDFPNETAKKIYELAIAAQAGSESATVRQLYHVMSLDLSKMTPKEKQFEAFYLDRPNLTREEAAKRFDAMYEKNYSDLENDLVQIDTHEISTRDAENKLTAKQKSLQESVKESGKTVDNDTPSPEVIKEVETQLESALSGFGGVALKFDDSKYGKLEIPMDKGKAQEFMSFLKNPQLLLDRITERSRDEHGKFNYQAYVREMFYWYNRESIDQKTQEHLINLGKVTGLQERKNIPKKDLTEQITTPVKKTFNQTMAEAVQKAGLAR